MLTLRFGELLKFSCHNTEEYCASDWTEVCVCLGDKQLTLKHMLGVAKCIWYLIAPAKPADCS